jgi:hypothetical protein
MVAAVVADLPVLAKHALEVAIGKKNIADPFAPANDRLFTPVNDNRRYAEFRSRLAISSPGRESVGIAFTGANVTCPEFLKDI